MPAASSLFGVPIYVSDVAPLSSKSIDYILNLKFLEMTDNDGWITETVTLLDDPRCLEIRNKILNAFDDYAYNLLKIKPEIEFYITTSWAIKFLPGGSTHSHTHSNSLFSGVLYLKAAEKTGQISFHKYKKYLDISSPTLTLGFTEWNIFNSDKWSITPNENQIIIFPSNLMHSVEINNSNEDRVSIAFNVFVKGDLGTRESALSLR
jgi:uncharacterized protein (TIGR02466 family)